MKIRYLYGPRGPWRRCFYCNVELVAYDKYAKICEDCEAMRRPIATRARTVVRQAIKDKHIKAASAYRCADCGGPADRYDHRDYLKPLQIAPVCNACNYKRGPGIIGNT